MRLKLPYSLGFCEPIISLRKVKDALLAESLNATTAAAAITLFFFYEPLKKILLRFWIGH